MERVIVLGGAGFIGSHLSDLLIEQGKKVLIFDNLTEQVHGPDKVWPEYLPTDAPPEGMQFWFGDIRDTAALMGALLEFRPDTIIHLAARVGVGQSNYMVADYVSGNVTATAILLHCLISYNVLVSERAEGLAGIEADSGDGEPVVRGFVEEPRHLEVHELFEAGDEIRLFNDVWTEWMALPEGLVGTEFTKWDADEEYRRPSELVKRVVFETQEEANLRHVAELAALKEDLTKNYPDQKVTQLFVAGSMSSYGEGAYMLGHPDGTYSHTRSPVEAVPVGTKEKDELQPASVYAMNKRDQEQLSLMVGRMHGLDVRVGRFFNVLGSRQALSNPYTGVAAIFASRVIAGKPPRIYEDGEQSRDFIHVSDVCSAIVAIMDGGTPGHVYNVGTGDSTSVAALAQMISAALDYKGPMEITGQYRAGDIRHCFADASKLKALGWEPQVSVMSAVVETCDWVRQEIASDKHGGEQAHDELLSRGLLS